MLRPFSRFCVMIGAIPESIIHSLSYEQQLLRLIKFLKQTVIPAIDGNTTAIKAIEDWIENVDLQEFVDTKLDEMAESGELTELIASYLELNSLICFNTFSDMLDSENLVDGSYAYIYGHTSISDGGQAHYKIRNSTNEDVIDGYLIASLTNSETLVAVLNEESVTPEMFGAIGDGTTDDTTSLQNAVNSNKEIHLGKKTYKVTSTILINDKTRIIGESMTESKIIASDSSVVFQYLTEVAGSHYDIKTNILLDNFYSECKNFIKINDNTLSDTDWQNQGSLLHIVFSNLYLTGLYNSITDSNKNTNVVPTQDELLGYGCAFNLNNIFDSTIKNCNIGFYGCAILLKGCDINKIEHNRFHHNGNHIRTNRVVSYGSQNTIRDNDVLQNLRYGGITIDSTRFDVIENNYFETYTASACHIKTSADWGTLITNNRIDNPTVNNINVIELDPRGGDIVIDNRMNPNASYKTYCHVDYNNLSNGNSFKNYNLATYRNNLGLLLNNAPFVDDGTLPYNTASPYYIDFINMNVGGGSYVSPFITKDSNTGVYYFHNTGTSTNVLIIDFVPKRKEKVVKTIRVWYKSTTNVQYFAVDGDGTSLFAGNKAMTDTGVLTYVDIDLSSNTSIYDRIRCQIPNKDGCLINKVEFL